MPRIQVVEIAKLPTGTARFQETVPALKNAYLAKVAEGKVTHLPQTIVNSGDGYTTTTTTSIWNNNADFQSFKNWVISNYGFLRSEYYYSVSKGHENKDVGANTTETEID